MTHDAAPVASAAHATFAQTFYAAACSGRWPSGSMALRRAETDRHIATYLLSQLGRFRTARADEIDNNTLRRLGQRAAWACATGEPDADHRDGRDDRGCWW